MTGVAGLGVGMAPSCVLAALAPLGPSWLSIPVAAVFGAPVEVGAATSGGLLFT